LAYKKTSFKMVIMILLYGQNKYFFAGF